MKNETKTKTISVVCQCHAVHDTNNDDHLELQIIPSEKSTADSSLIHVVNENRAKAVKTDSKTENADSSSSSSSSSSTTADDFALKVEKYIDSIEIPLFLVYFSIHQFIMIVCAGFYSMNHSVGVLFLSICPALSIMGLFIHFFLSKLNFNFAQVRKTFLSAKNYLLAIAVFSAGICSIAAIFYINTSLAKNIPMNMQFSDYRYTNDDNRYPIHSNILYPILKFPYNYAQLHHKVHEHAQTTAEEPEASSLLQQQRPFNYRLAFVGTIIAPFVEESFKYLLLAMTFPFGFIWDFSSVSVSSINLVFPLNTNTINTNKSTINSQSIVYASKSLFIIFLALCGACGIALMENIGYLAACEWTVAQSYCLPNRKFDIMGAGLARGVFSVPFHCVTACIMGDILAAWVSVFFTFNMRGALPCIANSKCVQRVLWLLWLLLSYPVSVFIPMFLHSSFNYWMKGLSQITAAWTSIGFAIVAIRIHHKYALIRKKDKKEKEKSDDTQSSGDHHRGSHSIADIETELLGIDSNHVRMRKIEEPAFIII